jgi:hypothetical protein
LTFGGVANADDLTKVQRDRAVGPTGRQDRDAPQSITSTRSLPSDAVMVARGDLGIECPLEDVRACRTPCGPFKRAYR